MINVHADDLYERLGLSRDAGSDEIRRAYRKLVRIHSPERSPEEFKRIRTSYETLIDPQTRQEYDDPPDPNIATWIYQAHHAFDEGAYDLAERYLDQILEREPEMALARNLLGLCYIQQDRPHEAIAEYEALLETSDATDAWYGNAGHAYRAAERYYDAARAFRRAIIIGDDVRSHYIGLADVYLDQDEYTRAARTLKRAIRASERADLDDLVYFIKLLEVYVRSDDVEGLDLTLRKIRHLASTPDERQTIAAQLATVAQQLLVLYAIEPAAAIAKTAYTLHPHNTEYETTHRLAQLLDQHDLAGAIDLIDSNPLFHSGRTLEALGLAVTHLGESVPTGKGHARPSPIVSGIAYIGRLIFTIFAYALAIVVIVLIRFCAAGFGMG